VSKECQNDCISPLLFPKRLDNRPGLSRIDYRIGTYADIREALMRSLNLDPVLAGWTHREADDPGIALLEGASILGDILTFYQELYANEAYLRTAQWRESIADLVRLLGYRLSPGLGGKATFAFEVKGDKPVVVPAGFPIKAQMEDIEKQVDLETEQETVAFPHLSQFHLYRPRLDGQIREGLNRLEVESVVVKDAEGNEEPVKDIANIQALALRPGDRIMLIPDTGTLDDPYLISDLYSIKDQYPVILIISKVEQILDRVIVEFEGSLTISGNETITAYRIGRSFRHFGYNAPALTTKLGESTLRLKLTQVDTEFDRIINKDYKPMGDDCKYYSALKGLDIPLDTEVDLAVGSKLICHGLFKIPNIRYMYSKDEPERHLTMIKEITSLCADALKWGNLSGPSTVVTFDSNLIAFDAIYNAKIDITKFKLYEVKSPKIYLRAPTQWDSGAIAADTQFNYWGTYQEALSLVGRKLILQKDDGTSLEVTVTSTLDNFSTDLQKRDKINPSLWPVTLASSVGSISDSFKLEDFDEQAPKVTVYGNLVEATQGKREKEAVLGNGNNQELFQTFKIPKSPLTYFRSEGETPPEVPELEVYVNDRLWTRVPSLFGHGPKEEIYIIREDSEGNSWVQFGDGKTGARLPSGFQNVVARYRTGTGAFGALKEGATVQAGARLNHLHKIHLPGIVTGGDVPESGENAREAAPGKVQSLGRLVSLQDFEAEALAIAGICKAKARWALHDNDNVPALVLTVLMDSGREKEHEEVRSILSEANRSRGAGRFPVIVNPGVRQYVELTLTVGYDPTFRQDLLEESIEEALGVIGDEGNGIDGSKGLFSVQKRQFGQPEYATRIEGTAQNIEGVVWARVKELELSRGKKRGLFKLECKDDALLCLQTADFEVNFVSVKPTEVPHDDRD
jgi:hypothetical protein